MEAVAEVVEKKGRGRPASPPQVAPVPVVDVVGEAVKRFGLSPVASRLPVVRDRIEDGEHLPALAAEWKASIEELDRLKTEAERIDHDRAVLLIEADRLPPAEARRELERIDDAEETLARRILPVIESLGAYPERVRRARLERSAVIAAEVAVEAERIGIEARRRYGQASQATIDGLVKAETGAKADVAAYLRGPVAEAFKLYDVKEVGSSGEFFRRRAGVTLQRILSRGV
jgi:hypothetical protein